MATATATPAAPNATTDKAPKPKATDTEKRNKFKELAESRVSFALAKIRTIGSLANPTNYKYSLKDVDQIRRALHNKVDEVCDRMVNALNSGKASKTVSEFQLPLDSE